MGLVNFSPFLTNSIILGVKGRGDDMGEERQVEGEEPEEEGEQVTAGGR